MVEIVHVVVAVADAVAAAAVDGAFVDRGDDRGDEKKSENAPFVHQHEDDSVCSWRQQLGVFGMASWTAMAWTGAPTG
jgi:ABC-type tungstate transport system permease subunit